MSYSLFISNAYHPHDFIGYKSCSNDDSQFPKEEDEVADGLNCCHAQDVRSLNKEKYHVNSKI